MKNLTLCVFITRSSQLWPVILFFMNHIIPCCFMRKFWQTYLNVRTAKQDAGVKIINLQKQLFDVSGKVHRAWRQEDKQTVTRTRKLHWQTQMRKQRRHYEKLDILNSWKKNATQKFLQKRRSFGFIVEVVPRRCSHVLKCTILIVEVKWFVLHFFTVSLQLGQHSWTVSVDKPGASMKTTGNCSNLRVKYAWEFMWNTHFSLGTGYPWNFCISTIW